LCAITQPLPDTFDTSVAAHLSTSASSATAANTDKAANTDGAANTNTDYAPTASVSAAISQPLATDTVCSTMHVASRAAASPSGPHVRGSAIRGSGCLEGIAGPSRQPGPLIRSPAVPSRHAAPASTGAVHGQQASRRPISAKGIASGAKDAACTLGTAFDHTGDQAGVEVLACSVVEGGAKCACSILGACGNAPGSGRGGSRGGFGRHAQGSGWQGGDPLPSPHMYGRFVEECPGDTPLHRLTSLRKRLPTPM